MSRGDLAAGKWAVLEPLLPVSNNRCGRWRDHQQVINGIIHRLGTGVQWRAAGAAGLLKRVPAKIGSASAGGGEPARPAGGGGAAGEGLGPSRGGLTCKIHVPCTGPGRPRRTPDSVSADKTYSNRKIRAYLRKRGIRHVIPEKKDHKAARLRRGSCGGRPPGFAKARYKDRNTVEHAIGKLKQFRAAATRYDKRGYVYLGTVTAAALLIWLRS
ncbi:transposase [Streptomyces sp. NPDC055400]